MQSKLTRSLPLRATNVLDCWLCESGEYGEFCCVQHQMAARGIEALGRPMQLTRALVFAGSNLYEALGSPLSGDCDHRWTRPTADGKYLICDPHCGRIVAANDPHKEPTEPPPKVDRLPVSKPRVRPPRGGVA